MFCPHLPIPIIENMICFRKSICLLICIAMLAVMFVGCEQAKQPEPTVNTTVPTSSEPISYSVKVQNEAGTALDKVTVEIYTDSSLTDILQVQKTDSDGLIQFNRKGSGEGLVAVLKNAPVGYQVQESYALTGENTVITLKAGTTLTDAHLDSAKLTLGDAIPGFSFTASDGTEVVLSELLAQYNAVILNFWYMGCTPCKMEFPYLQQAYTQFSDQVAVIAMNPMDSTDAEIETFRQNNGYTFLMGKCDPRWGDMMNISAYPVTVVIDRFGNISMIHNGSVDNAQMFMDMFHYFSADDYEQSFIRSHSQLPTYEP